MRFQNKLSKIKLVALDVDGVLTDTRVFLDSTGEWRRFYSIRDGFGIVHLRKLGYKFAIITAANCEDVRERAKMLKIDHFYENQHDKEPAFHQLIQDSGLNANEIAYMGDDLPDIPLLKQAGFAATVPGAISRVKEVVDWVSEREGGMGAVRELCELVEFHGYYTVNKGG